jgi:hypothetical protein
MSHDPEEQDDTIENRVYLFRDLACAWIEKRGELLGSVNTDDRQRALDALALIAFASCTVADSGDEDPAEVAKRIARGP